jgi:hypothetical protein
MELNITNKISLLLVLAVLWITPTDVMAQFAVSGSVVEAETEEPLAGVNILVKGEQRGAATAPDGTFELEATAETDTLIFSFVGFIMAAISDSFFCL